MYSQVFVAGTFDGLHKGHQALLRRAFAEGEKVTIGLTSDDFVRKYKVQQFATQGYSGYVKRLEELEQWLAGERLIPKATIIPIDDPYEPAASEEELEAIVVTPENKHRAENINNMRLTRGLKPLILLEVALVPAQDGQPISSTRVKGGTIDETGRLVMPEKLRSALARPLGPVLSGSQIGKSLENHRRSLVITVGDVATKTLLDAGRAPALAVIDLRVGREPYHELDTVLATSGAAITRLKSGPGFISQAASSAIKEWGIKVTQEVAQQHILVIEGEEDLLTLPAIAGSPLGSVVYYGQPARNASANVAGEPDQGLVEVEVTQAKKEEAIALLSQFT